MEHWYVYYKCPRTLRGETIARVRSMQASLAARSGVMGRLVQRVDADTDTTLMEIYEHIEKTEPFAAALEGALAGSGLAAELSLARHTERFRDL
jgi:hypothetical protein